jgi:hypothetical protein
MRVAFGRHQVQDMGFAPRRHDAAVRLADEIGQRLAQPVIAPRIPRCRVHALLDHRPLTVRREHERVVVER